MTISEALEQAHYGNFDFEPAIEDNWAVESASEDELLNWLYGTVGLTDEDIDAMLCEGMTIHDIAANAELDGFVFTGQFYS